MLFLEANYARINQYPKAGYGNVLFKEMHLNAYSGNKNGRQIIGMLNYTLKKYSMDNSQIEEALNNTFPGLTMYYRDCELRQDLISKYSVDQIIMEKRITDVSSFAGGLTKNLRYAIASNAAVSMGQMNPESEKYGFNLISAPSYYSILDIYAVGNKTQILLLNFDEKYLNIFTSIKTDIEKKVIEMGRESLEKKILIEPNDALNEEEWIERTQFPIGMSDDGDFFK